MTELKRKTLKLSQPNPLFEKWLQEWKDDAAYRNSDTQYAFAKAIKSLKKYPLPLKTGKECMILENFGTRICLLLDRKLNDYKKSHGTCLEKEENKINKPRKTVSKPKLSSDLNCDIDKLQEINEQIGIETSKKKSTKTKSSPPKKNDKIYIPTLRSSSYAVLVALYIHLNKPGAPGEMTKEELQTASQPLCDTSMWKPLPGSYYSGWSCVGQLVSKGLVQRKGNPHRYSLTEDGMLLAGKLPVIGEDPNIPAFPTPAPAPSAQKTKSRIVNNENQKHPTRKSCKKGIFHKTDVPTGAQDPLSQLSQEERDSLSQPCERDSQSQSSTATVNSNYEQIILLQGQFEVILLIDTQEIHRGDELVKAVQAYGINLEVRRLKVGDFAWISRNPEGQELLLPYIVERKRLDDLASSIKDGRFHEQKFRMKQSGVPNCMYLVEGYGQRQFSLPVSTLLQAAVNTQFIDRFTVKYTDNLHESAVYLANFTKAITRKFSNKTLLGCQKHLLPEFDIQEDCISLMSFGEFNKLANKTRKYSIREMFIKQLVQLRGLSVEKALAIVERYPSPRSLATAFENEGHEKFISEITVGHLNRKIGPAISKALYELYGQLNLS